MEGRTPNCREEQEQLLTWPVGGSNGGWGTTPKLGEISIRDNAAQCKSSVCCCDTWSWQYGQTNLARWCQGVNSHFAA